MELPPLLVDRSAISLHLLRSATSYLLPLHLALLLAHPPIIAMYIQRVHLQNICGIPDLSLDLSQSQIPNQNPPSTIVIGRNGTGKSSILRAIVLGLASVSDAAALLTEQFGSPFVSVDRSSGSITLDTVDESGAIHKVGKTIERSEDGTERVLRLEDTSNLEPPLVVAFGAGRANTGADNSKKQYTPVDSTYMLFSYEGTFISPELTLRRLFDYETIKHEAVLERIKEALGLSDSDHLSFPPGGGVSVSGPYREQPIPLDSWADGYRITLNWILDIYAWAMKHSTAIDNSGHVRGILLVDEVEQHLHPSMQRYIIESLKMLFPEMQIIASTHSPIVAQGVPSEELKSLQRDSSGVSVLGSREYYGYSVEDYLTDQELFGTAAYGKGIEKMREEYVDLISKDELSEEEHFRLRALGESLARVRMVSPRLEGQDLEDLQKRVVDLMDD